MSKVIRWSLTLMIFFMLFAPQTMATPAQVVVPIRPAPGFQSSGQAIVDVTASGDLMLQVSVQGPRHEISRNEHGTLWTNLIWHIVEGTCDAWIGETVDRGNILYRFIEAPDHPDSLRFRTIIARVWLGQGDGRSLALVAFRNGGGGPLYACGDL